LNRVAPAANRRRSEFIRQAIKSAIRTQEFAMMKAACLKQPDSASGADDWSNADEFVPV
jgi:hypothetical protein